MGWVFYIDGEYVDERDALIPATDVAVLRGYGAFDFLRTYGLKPFHLAEHIQRLRYSANAIEMDLPWTDAELEAIVLQTLARNRDQLSGEANIRLVVTGGYSPDNLIPADEPRLLVMVTPAAPIPPTNYRDGVKIITEHVERYLPESKSINYIPAIRAMRRARRVGAVEAIYVDRTGNALEGTTTNLFAFIDGQLVTPPDKILSGITRAVVMRLAAPEFELVERTIPLADLLRADEVFITASNKQIMPVVQIDDTRIADGIPGARTRHIMHLFGGYTGEALAGAAPLD